MKKLILLTNCFFLGTLFISIESKAQLDKGTWLFGGSGSFSSTKNTLSRGNIYFEADDVDILISSNAGYFIADKFSAGLKPSYTKHKAKIITQGGVSFNSDIFEIGPFARYYFINKKKRFNLLTEAAYQFGCSNLSFGNGHNGTLSLMAGPVLYFNSSIGLEFLLGYYNRNETIEGISESEQKGIRMTIGFQFHLGRMTD
ncbi:MAG TPA: hypothetical protein VK166_01080 [Chitinophagaceae bacterium]|nr:hypothetical protein [Chitinophagaceae bacterium]